MMQAAMFSDSRPVVTRHELRPYQLDALDDLRRCFGRGLKRVGLMLPTGAGKTTVACEMIRGAVEKGKRVLFICDRVELIDQTSRRMDAEGIAHGVIQAQHERCRPWEPVQVCSIHTLARRRWPDADFIVVDEFHTVYRAMTVMCERWNAVPMVGLSATPFTKGLGRHWQHLVVGSTTQELIDDGYLVPPVVYGPPGPDLSKVATVAGEYHQGQLGEATDQPKLVADIVGTWLSRGEDRQTICFATNIAHSKHIVSEFVRAGIPAAHVDAHTESEERAESLAAFARGEVRIVSCVDVLTKGYDQPQASCLILARPTKSLTVYVQQVGRVLRPAPGKTDAIVLDHAGNTARLGFATDPLPSRLDDGKRKESKAGEKKAPLPKPCAKCKFMKPPKIHACPKCGFAPERQNEVEVEAGELVKVKKADKGTKQRWYSMLLHVAEKRGYATGWAAHKYREKFGVWPRGLNDTPLEPDVEVAGYVKHLQIRYAKRKGITQCRYCGSQSLEDRPGKGPHAAGIGCKDCGRHLGWKPKR